VDQGLPATEPQFSPGPFRPRTSPSAPPKREGEFGIRRFIESAILFTVAVLTVRSLALEPFGVPTGSMAMTMVGNHKACTCPRCGYHVIVGSGSNGKPDSAAAERAYSTAWCPNCGRGDLHLETVPETVGDRLLVDKNTFDLRRPRRWEVAVFRNPSDMSKPYVKRIVALPSERVQVRGGDVYINDELSRKTLAESRPMRVLVFDQSFVPPGGWGKRWVNGQSDVGDTELTRRKSSPPADEYVDGPKLRFPASPADGDYRWIVYRHWLLDEDREEPIRDWFAYNGAALQQELTEVHDFSVEFDVEASAAGAALALKLYDGQNNVTVEIPVEFSAAKGGVVKLSGTDVTADAVPGVCLKEGQTHHVEFAFVDRRVMLAIDGREAFAPVDLPAVATRRGVSRPVWLGTKGAAMTVHGFRLYRDVHYTAAGRNGIHETWPLGPDEYFLLGDNSANSEDSRFWQRPGVPEQNFLGRPLLLHQPSHWSTLGSWHLQCLDWGRMRWIR
jgi:signal peptidase I